MEGQGRVSTDCVGHIQLRWRWRGGLGSDDGGAESWQRAEHEWRRHATVCSGSGGSSGFVF
uniref:Uncharacterized protein n=1 Tax=Oryza nivara TaxID=4536 RepID=A0A0E0IHJ3_ORYNI